jgi:DNA-binding transcriptional ArsR family regulator
MFVSSVRREVAELLVKKLTLNEIAHQLGVARSTVGHHTDVLRREHEQRSVEKVGRTGYTGPAARPEVTRARVQHLLQMGYTRAKIARTLGLARSTVTYHAARLGADVDDRCSRRYDWDAIRSFYDAGHTVAECRSRFGFNKQTWHAAIQRGLITARPARIPLEQLLVAGPRRSRNHLKTRLFNAGVKTRR